MSSDEALTPTDRTKFNRYPGRGSYERAEIDAIIDESLVCHVGFVEDGLPVVIPASPWRIGDWLYLHGAPKSRLMAAFADGRPLCVSFAFVDGLIMARSAMRHSTDYRSAMLFGTGEAVDDPEEKARVLMPLIDKLSPGRAELVRPPNVSELAVTAVARMAIREGSAKIRKAPPTMVEPDAGWTPWTGTVPLSIRAGQPQPTEDSNDRPPPILPRWLG